MKGHLRKMIVQLSDPVNYQVPLDEQRFPVSDYLGHNITLRYAGEIHCVSCGRKTNKSFSQGHCYPCMKSLAACDMCIVRPETCHYHEGTCREPDWGDAHCMQDHIVYLANSSGLKVGITRQTQVPVRWIDQGATQALPVFRVKNRYVSGLVEVVLKKQVSDRTDWRKMLKGEAVEVDLPNKRDEFVANCKQELEEICAQFGDDAISPLEHEQIVAIRYPVDVYPEKIKSLNLDKTPEISGKLTGIKGQYLILETGVINIRKYAGYLVEIDASKVELGNP